jgi:hypothetical protein
MAANGSIGYAEDHDFLFLAYTRPIRLPPPDTLMAPSHPSSPN